LIGFSGRPIVVARLGKKAAESHEVHGWIRPRYILGQDIQCVPLTTEICEGQGEIGGDLVVGRPSLVRDAQMIDPGLNLPCLAPQHAEHRIQRYDVAAAGKGALANLACFNQRASTCGADCLANRLRCVVVEQ
jgi:hypothetical protein